MCEFTQVAMLSGFQGVVWAQGLGCQWVKENSREVGTPEQAVVPSFVAPAGVSEWVTSPRLLCMHYYFSSMLSLARETALYYFPGPQLAGSTESIV